MIVFRCSRVASAKSRSGRLWPTDSAASCSDETAWWRNRGIDALGVARGPLTVSRQNEVARVISLPGRLTPVSWQLPNDLSYEDWLHYGKMLAQMQGAIQWALGDWWVHGEHKYGKRVKALRDGAFGTYAIQTLKNFGWVAKHVETSRRRDVLTFGTTKPSPLCPLPNKNIGWNGLPVNGCQCIGCGNPSRQRRWYARLRTVRTAIIAAADAARADRSRGLAGACGRVGSGACERADRARPDHPQGGDGFFGLLVEQVGRGGAADLLDDNLNNRERAALAGVVTDTSFRILLRRRRP